MRTSLSPEKKTVLLVGTYSGLNKGDRLMQQVVARKLVALDGSISINLASPFPDIDRAIYKELNVVRSRRRNLPLSFIKLFLLLLLPESFRIKYAANDAELREYVAAVLVVDTSGDMLTEDYGVHVAMSHLFPLLFSILLKKKFVVLAQSIGPFKYLRGLFRFVLSKAVHITARDGISYQYLLDMGLTNVEEVADLGFLLEPELSDCRQLNEAKQTGRLLIGFCPSGLLLSKFGNKIGFDPLQALCKKLQDFAAHSGCVYVLIPHVMTPSGLMDDAVLCAQMADKLGDSCRLISSDYEPAQIKAIVAQLDFMVSFRMHGAIAGLDTGVPTLSVSYSHKTHGLYQKLGMDEWIVVNDELMMDTLVEKLAALIDHGKEVRLRLNEVLPAIRQSARHNISLLLKEAQS
jgi:polysaccharide pyruvyl transferase WcaK-like protein